MRRYKSFFLKSLKHLGLLDYVNTSTHVPLKNGRSVTVPLLRSAGTQNLDHREPWLESLIGELLELKDGAFLDVGVNLGQTLLKFLTYGDERPYYGFEPNPHCCAYVEELVTLNKLENINVIPVGLSDHTSVRKLFLKQSYAGSASMIRGLRSEEYYERWSYIPVFRGDNLIEDFPITKISIVKIDVEGAELEVLTGLRRTITNLRPYIICEILPVYDEHSRQGRHRRERTDAVTTLMKRLGYAIARIGHDRSIDVLDAIETHDDLELSNYLFIPREDLQGVQSHMISQ